MTKFKDLPENVRVSTSAKRATNKDARNSPTFHHFPELRDADLLSTRRSICWKAERSVHTIPVELSVLASTGVSERAMTRIVSRQKHLQFR
jgi:hypothetical protein